MKRTGTAVGFLLLAIGFSVFWVARTSRQTVHAQDSTHQLDPPQQLEVQYMVSDTTWEIETVEKAVRWSLETVGDRIWLRIENEKGRSVYVTYDRVLTFSHEPAEKEEDE